MCLTKEIMYKATQENDSKFDGQFFIGHNSARIFCIPSCTKRKSSREDLIFFNSFQECIFKGYSPCTYCNPFELINKIPPFIEGLLKALANNSKIKDSDLIIQGIDPQIVRRWFLKNHGFSFQAYQRMLKINSACKKIQAGASVVEAAFSSGYNSLSGFGDSFKQIIGVSPINSKQLRIIDQTRIQTPLGPMFACAIKEGICFLDFIDRPNIHADLINLSKNFNATISLGQNQLFQKLETQLTQYFQGKRKVFTIPIYPFNKNDNQNLSNQIINIEYGKTSSFPNPVNAEFDSTFPDEIFKKTGNNIRILIPCHRLILRGDYSTNYSLENWRQKWLIEWEQKNTNS